MFDDVVKLLKEPTSEIPEWVSAYMMENHGKIMRKAYSGQEYSLPVMASYVVDHIAKSDPVVLDFVLSLSVDSRDVREIVYSVVTNTPIVCGRGKKRLFKNPIKGFGYCGTNKSCECFMNREELRDKAVMAERQRKREATMVERFGAANVMQATSEDAVAARNAIKKTNLERYGVEHVLQNESIQQKSRKTSMERYGVEHATQSDAVKEKIKQTNIERYGVENPGKVKEFRGKAEQTYFEKTGYRNPFANPEVIERTQKKNRSNMEAIKEKIRRAHFERHGSWYLSTTDGRDRLRATNSERYGGNPMFDEGVKTRLRQTNDERYGGHPMSSEAVRERVAKTNIERYGGHPMTNKAIKERVAQTNVDRYGGHPMSSPEIKDRLRESNNRKYGGHPMSTEDVKNRVHQTNLERYGGNPKQRHYPAGLLETLSDPDMLTDALSKQSVRSFANDNGIDLSTVYNYASLHGIKFPGSSYEVEIANFLTENGIEFQERSRRVIAPYELDFFIPESNVGIEFNGLYWHSSAVIEDTRYHRKKWRACEDVGVRLLMINEDEWLTKSSSIKKKILNLCGRSEKSVGARKLRIGEVDRKIANDFVHANHIQGRAYGVTHAIGAHYGDDLVAVILFNRQRGTGDLELIRFCTDGKLYAGVFSRMMNYFTKQYPDIDRIISFADLRYSDGNLYRKNGFIEDRIISPDYRYIIGHKTFHKSSFTLDKIEKRFGITGVPERVAMESLGIHRIYDCGKIRFVWNRA